MNFELKPGDWESIRRMTSHLQIKFFILLSSRMDSSKSFPCNWKEEFSNTLGIRISIIDNIIEILEWDEHIFLDKNMIQTRERQIVIQSK